MKWYEVEVADFDNQQIETFVNNWFKGKDKPKAARLLEKLKENKSLQELAKSPLLLTLLCLVFEKTNNLPEKQANLFKEGLDLLLKKWDETNDVDRDIARYFRGERIYKELSSEDKADMLGEIAFRSFVNSEYFFQKEDLQHQIKDYICNLPEAATNPEASRLDSEAVLKAIEHHHGLLVERARNIYSFSHLTFQEYFTAREIDRERKLETLIQHLTEPRWKEVFLLTAEMLRRSDDFLLMMKESIDQMMAEDKKLQAFLDWAEQKTNFIQTIYKNFAVRAFYLFVEFRALVIDYSRIRAIVITFDQSLGEALDFNHPSVIDDPLNLDLALHHARNHSLALFLDSRRALALNLDQTLTRSLARALKYTLEDRVLQKAIQTLKDRLPSVSNERKVGFQWWKTHGEKWVDELREICINHRNIGHDWQFTDEQVRLLLKYLEVNSLLVECMNRSYITKQVHREIESKLLLASTAKKSN